MMCTMLTRACVYHGGRAGAELRNAQNTTT